MTFFTPGELAGIRSMVEELGFATTVRIKDRVDTTTDDGSSETWVARATTTKGWLYSTPTPMITVIAGAQGTVNTYRLFLPVGTDIEPGDRVVIEGSEFVVSDTNFESTWLPLLGCSLRRVE